MGTDGLTMPELERHLAEAQAFAERAKAHADGLQAIVDRRRHTHSTIDGIEEAIGLCVSILMDEELASRLREEKFRRLREVLDKVRQSPTAYRDVTRPHLVDLRSYLDDFELWRSRK